MKRMPYKQFNKLVRRLQRAGCYIRKPRRRGRMGWTSWTISRQGREHYSYQPGRKSRSIPSIYFDCQTQTDFIRAARYILDGGPRPPYKLPAR